MENDQVSIIRNLGTERTAAGGPFGWMERLSRSATGRHADTKPREEKGKWGRGMRMDGFEMEWMSERRRER
jgi:hypothetical protein